MYQRTRQSVSGTQQSQEMQSLVPSPLTSAPPSNVQKLRAATDIATETFTQQQFEAFGLQIKADIGTIAPEEQERLGWLQTEMDDFWTQRLEQASQFGRPLTQIPLHPPNQAESASQMHSQKAPPMPLPIQTKLTIGAVGDRYEQEADRVAAKVVEQIHSPTTSQMHPNAAVQRQIQFQEESEERLRMMPVQRLPIHGSLQRVAMADEIPVGEASVPFETVVNQRRGGGQPLEHDLQRSMEQAMGADFSRVRIHTDAQSDGLNRSIQAQAFTTGQDVFFRRGMYQPGSRSGQEVIAHELTHVMQQNTTAIDKRSVGQNNRKEVERVGIEATHCTQEAVIQRADKLEDGTDLQVLVDQKDKKMLEELSVIYATNDEEKDKIYAAMDELDKKPVSSDPSDSDPSYDPEHEWNGLIPIDFDQKQTVEGKTYIFRNDSQGCLDFEKPIGEGASVTIEKNVQINTADDKIAGIDKDKDLQQPKKSNYWHFKAANIVAGMAEFGGYSPPDLTWHHHQNKGRMQLLDRAVHAAFLHKGGKSIWGTSGD